MDEVAEKGQCGFIDGRKERSSP